MVIIGVKMSQKNAIIIGTILLIVLIIFIGAYAIYANAVSYDSDEDETMVSYSQPPTVINNYYNGKDSDQETQSQYQSDRRVRVDQYTSYDSSRPIQYTNYNYNYPSYRLNSYHQGYYRRYYYYPYNHPYYPHYPNPGFTKRPPNIYY